MGRVARALVVHELSERTRDRWVLVISVLFALLASAVSLYGRSAGATAAKLTGPSLVTLVSLLVPLVALVLGHDAVVGERERNTLGLLLSLPVTKLEVVLSKFLGRLLALTAAVALGLGAAVAMASPENRGVLMQLMLPTLLLGAAFLSLGVLISAAVRRQLAAASAVVAVWFLLVFFYDLGLLGLLVLTQGGIAPGTVADLVVANPAGLFRIEMMQRFGGPDVLSNLGMKVSPPSPVVIGVLWAAWVLVPLALSGLLLSRQKVSR